MIVENSFWSVVIVQISLFFHSILFFSAGVYLPKSHTSCYAISLWLFALEMFDLNIELRRVSCCYVVIASLSYVEWNEIINNFGSKYCEFAALTQTHTQPVSIYAITVTMWLSITTALWVLHCTFPNGLQRTIRDSASLYCTRFGFDLNRTKCGCIRFISMCVILNSVCVSAHAVFVLCGCLAVFARLLCFKLLLYLFYLIQSH